MDTRFSPAVCPRIPLVHGSPAFSVRMFVTKTYNRPPQQIRYPSLSLFDQTKVKHSQSFSYYTPHMPARQQFVIENFQI